MFKEICLPNVAKNKYFVNEYGEVYSGFKKDLLTPYDTNGRGYLRVKLGRGTAYMISHLVAYTFIGPPPDFIKDPTINHKDENPLNNFYKNLEWMERSENSRLKPHQIKGTNLWSATASEEQVLQAWKLLNETDLTLTQIAEITKIYSEKIIYNIKVKRSWKWLTDDYPYSKDKEVENVN